MRGNEDQIAIIRSGDPDNRHIRMLMLYLNRVTCDALLGGDVLASRKKIVIAAEEVLLDKFV